MIGPFSFASAGRILFGRGVSEQLPLLARGFGRRPLVVCGKHPERHQSQLAALAALGLSPHVVTVPGEPTTQEAQEATKAGVAHGADVVVGLGGGSVLDLAKAVAGLLGSGGEPLDYLEVVGKGLPLRAPPLPWIAVPTTAGTGAEVTKNAVLASPEHGVKVSLRSELLLPRLALVDPLLTLTVPPHVTAATGFDALTQVVEPFLSPFANPITDGFCREGILRAGRSLLRAIEDGSDVDAREDLSMTSLLGGLALANAKLGAVHGFAGPLGGMFDAPHGALCAALLPASLELNHRALCERDPVSPAIARLGEVARLLTGDAHATAEAAIPHVRELSRRAGIPGLSSFGVAREQFGEIVSKAQRASSMKGNPITLSPEELSEILERSW